MLKELIAVWNYDSPLAELFKRFDEMLVIAKDMFSISTSYMNQEIADGSVCEQIIKMDSKLNTLQQVISRDIVTHISVSGTNDVVPCLLLISLTKDIERVGDYCKNIEEVFSRAQDLKKDPIASTLENMRKKIFVWFEQTQKAFDTNDRELARITREEAYLYEKECDRLVWGLVADINGRNGVAAALALRFFKRVIAHLGNICTSVIMPFDKLDYFDKQQRGEG